VLQSRRTRPFLGESLQKPVSDLRTAKDLRTEQAAHARERSLAFLVTGVTMG